MANNPRFEKQTVSNTGTREKHVPKMAKAGVSTSRVNTPGFYLAWAARCLPWAASWVSQVCGPLWDWRCCFLPLSPPVTAYLWVSEQSLPSTSRAVSRRTLPPMGSSWRNPALLLPGLALQSPAASCSSGLADGLALQSFIAFSHPFQEKKHATLDCFSLIQLRATEY